MDLTKWAKDVAQNMNDVRRRFATKLLTSIVKKTPVDTGRARGNWQFGIGEPEIKKIEEIRVNPIEAEKPKLEEVKGDEPIYISNNIEYIEPLEYGHSKQAPNGMVGLSIAKAGKMWEQAVKESNRRK